MKREAEVRPGALDRGIRERGIEPGLCYHVGYLLLDGCADAPKENTYHWAIPPLDKRAPHGGVLGWVAYKHQTFSQKNT